MKLIKFLLALSLFIPAIGFAQGNAGTVGSVSVSLTLTYSKPGVIERDDEGKATGFYVDEQTRTFIKTNSKTEEIISEETVVESSTKMATAKYSNKEILLDLLDMGLLPGIGERDPAISGWSIVHVTGGEEPSVGLSRVLARHTSKVWVDISSFFQLSSEAEGALNISGRRSDKTVNTADGNSKTTWSETYTATFKTAASFNMNDVFFGQGILTGGAKLTFMSYWDEYDELTKYPVYVPSAVKLAGISGQGTYTLYDIPVVLEGTFSIGAAKAYYDIDTYLGYE